MIDMKGQAEIISAIIIILIALSLVGAAYLWGFPLIEKRQHEAVAKRVVSYFDQENVNSLPSRIEYIARFGGTEIFTIDANGIWTINTTENSIYFTFYSKATPIGYDVGWISTECNSTTGEVINKIGQIGIDKASVVCAKADKLGDGFNITYKVVYRELIDNTTGRINKIELVPQYNMLSSTTKTLQIRRGAIKSIGTNITIEVEIVFR